MGRAVNPAHARTAAADIVRALVEAGHTAYFAGGCVRDELLGLSPADYDVATDATPDRIKSLFKRTDEVGVAFGVVLVHVPVENERVSVEVATFRSDGPYTDKRRPDVIHFSDAQSDARRRDFTVNALYLNPLAGDPSVRIIDFVGGVGDLNARVLRAVGDADARLSEDHLRALRAVRLAARLGFTIEPATAAAIRRHASGLLGVSRERIGDEMRRIMSHPSRGRGVRLLAELGLDAPVTDSPHVEPPPAGRSVLDALPPATPFPTCLAAWALDRTPDAAGAETRLTEAWRKSLCLSNEESDALTAALRALRVIRHSWGSLPVAGQKRAAVVPGFREALTLLAAIDPDAADRVRARVGELERSGLAPAPLLTGDMLVAEGWKPGPRFKRVLDAVYDAQLEGRLATPLEALALARELARNQGV